MITIFIFKLLNFSDYRLSYGKVSCPDNRHTKRTSLSNKASNQQRHKRQHKHTCPHFYKNKSTRHDLDETGAEISLPSDLLESEVSVPFQQSSIPLLISSLFHFINF